MDIERKMEERTEKEERERERRKGMQGKEKEKNKKFELTSTGRAKAYSSSCPQAPITVLTGPGVESLRFSPNALPTTPRHQRQYRGATL